MRIVAALLVLLATGCGPDAAPRYLVLATTTSLGNSGLLDALVPAWRQQEGAEVRPTLVGSGRALRMLEQGQADVAISHAPETETAMLRQHSNWLYRKIMFNDFVLVGPRSDPAAVKAAISIDDALRRMVSANARFVSRGDQSGTHERERALWKSAGVAPAPRALLTSGAGMAVTLRQASDREAYTLTDRATFALLRDRLELDVVREGDPLLINTYAVIVDLDGARSADARRFAEWLTRSGGRQVISSYRIGESDSPPFIPWPETAGHEPQAVPLYR